MRKSLLFALALAGAASVVTPEVTTAPTVIVGREEPTRKRQRKNKTANKINVFMGYASDRKGKGKKAREASRRRSKGWS